MSICAYVRTCVCNYAHMFIVYLHNVVKDAVSVVTVQQYGCCVITSVVAHWLVTNNISPKDFDVSQLSTESTAQCKATHINCYNQ